MKETASRFIGIDVQIQRGCTYAIMDEEGEPIDAGCLLQNGTSAVVDAIREIVQTQMSGGPFRVFMGIDAPRVPLSSPRKWFWDGRRRVWRKREGVEQGNGRHCEIIIKAHGLANPQWTPCKQPYPSWMQLGFSLFSHIGKDLPVFEIFPSASYSLLAGDTSLGIGIRLGDFAVGPKDMLDAYVAAATVREFVVGRGIAIGGGDGYGQIILP